MKRRNTAGGSAIGYVRVSTQEQSREGVSLAAQGERIRAYCAMSGLELVRMISEEGVSGAKKLETRPGGAELVTAIARKAAGHIVSVKLDRLFRDAADALTQTKDWDAQGVALHLIDMGGQALNTASPMGRFFLSLAAGFAELERNLIAERTSTALQHKKAQRSVYGHTPYGFARIGDALFPAAEELAIVAQIRAWRGESWTLTSIADELNRLEVAPKRGGKRWYASTVRNVLANEIHI